jgi:general stress protein 26
MPPNKAARMTDEDHLARVWDIIEHARVAMLTTQFDGGLRARPLEPRPDREAGIIRFVTDVRGGKDDEIEAEHDVGLIIIEEKSHAYLSLTGRACVTRDAAQAKAIWKKTDDVWWPGGPNDVNVRVLRLEPITAELWDGPSSSAVVAIEFAKARITGEKPFLGENRKKTVPMG